MENKFLETINQNLGFRNIQMVMQQLQEVMKKKNLIQMKVVLLLILNRIKF
jgi:hypothetical protein